MADDNQIQDEYQLADLDGLDTNTTERTPDADEPVSFSEKKSFAYSENTRRNAIIAISIFILAIIVYKFISSHSAEKKHDKNATQSMPKTPAITPAPSTFAQTPQRITVAQPVSVAVPNPADANKINQKLSTLELNQRSMREDFTSVNNQLGGINNNMHEMMNQMAEITKAVSNLSAVAEAQSREIERLVAVKAKKVRIMPTQPMAAPVKYYIQAVIPGRAWLLSTNGNSVTVRVGTVVNGYGVVKLIDAVQGRVMTSSGQIIKFSQADS